MAELESIIWGETTPTYDWMMRSSERACENKECSLYHVDGTWDFYAENIVGIGPARDNWAKPGQLSIVLECPKCHELYWFHCYEGLFGAISEKRKEKGLPFI